MRLSGKEGRRLKDRYGSWAVVTGASSGIGRSLAENLAAASLNLVLIARNKSELESFAEDLFERYGIETYVLAEDLGDPKACDRIFAYTADLKVGLLVAAAGFGTSGYFHQGDLAAEVQMLRVNAEAVMRMTHHFAKQFVWQRRGGIILMSSLVAFQGVPYAANYAATKAYIQSLAEALAVELRPFGVDVLAAAPGPVASGFGKRAGMSMGKPPSAENIGARILKKLGRGYLVMPGFLSKFLIFSLKTLPRRFAVRAMQVVMGAMTREKRGVA